MGSVRIDGGFWAPRLRVNREQTLPSLYRQCQETGRLDALKLNWSPGQGPKPHVFWESDIAKWIEAASYSLATHPDPELDARVDQVIALLAGAQQPDGYLNVYFTVVEPDKRFTDLRDAHELYCAGHLMEAAVAHFQGTGKRTLLTVACRYADCIAGVFGRGPGQKRGYCGHPEIEVALVRLYQATGEQRYLELSQYFVDERGQQPNYFDLEREARGGTPSYFDWYYSQPGRTYVHAYNQSHRPVREQDQVVGHAVRAMYLYSAMAGLAAETGDRSLRDACRRLWHHLCSTRMYVTGGLGSTDRNEGFTGDYDLPNASAYCETCAAIALIFWSQRMLHLDGDGQYADVLERALYNNVLAGGSLDGQRFFYDNPLESRGDQHRQPWFDVSCCPPNLARLLASLGQYICAEGEEEATVHQYIQSEAELHVGGRTVHLRQTTNYPWEGQVRITLDPGAAGAFGLKLRIPGWCRQARLAVNGEPLPVTTARGYARIFRRWAPGDVVELELPMAVERVYAHPHVPMNCGRVALQRGPVIYCLEEADNGPDLHAMALPRGARLEAIWEPDLLGGCTTLRGTACRQATGDWQGTLYRAQPPLLEPVAIQAIPYFLWDNRAPGEMLVWMREG